MLKNTRLKKYEEIQAVRHIMVAFLDRAVRVLPMHISRAASNELSPTLKTMLSILGPVVVREVVLEPETMPDALSNSIRL